MKIFIFKYLLIITAITGAFSSEPAQAQNLPNVSVPHWMEPYKQQIWTPQGLLTLAALGVESYWIMSGNHKNGSRMQASVKPIDVMQDVFSDVTQELNALSNLHE
jgi:hypothetical protein